VPGELPLYQRKIGLGTRLKNNISIHLFASHKNTSAWGQLATALRVDSVAIDLVRVDIVTPSPGHLILHYMIKVLWL